MMTLGPLCRYSVCLVYLLCRGKEKDKRTCKCYGVRILQWIITLYHWLCIEVSVYRETIVMHAECSTYTLFTSLRLRASSMNIFPLLRRIATVNQEYSS